MLPRHWHSRRRKAPTRRVGYDSPAKHSTRTSAKGAEADTSALKASDDQPYYDIEDGEGQCVSDLFGLARGRPRGTR
eukprot:3215179-Rhodomonas_salina.1